MGWNEPPKDKNSKNQDPWGEHNNNDGPPDLDEIVRKMQSSFSGIFGQGKSNKKNNGSFPYIMIFLLFLAWLVFDMTYFIDEQERGVVLRLGSYVETLDPGLQIRFPRPIETVTKVNVGQVRKFTHKALMLTKDENIVDVEVAVQWRVGDATRYLFNVLGPILTLTQVTESVVREVIGKSTLDFILTDGRSQVAQQIQDLTQVTLDDGKGVATSMEDYYQTGIHILAVRMQPAKPPEEVKAAFDDAIKAREDEQRQVNEAEAYHNDIIPKARGGAARLMEEAEGYTSRIVSKAEGEASRFEQLLVEYKRAPAITRERLYIDTIEHVLSNTNKVLIDNDNGNSLMYLPIDKLINKDGGNNRITQDILNRSSSSTAYPPSFPKNKIDNEQVKAPNNNWRIR